MNSNSSHGLSRHRAPRSRDTLTLEQALGRSEPLARLTDRLRESSARYAALRGVLPDELLAHISAGPVDELGWSLMAANAAVAAKLRQLKPRIESHLLQQGFAAVEVRVKVRQA